MSENRIYVSHSKNCVSVYFVSIYQHWLQFTINVLIIIYIFRSQLISIFYLFRRSVFRCGFTKNNCVPFICFVFLCHIDIGSWRGVFRWKFFEMQEGLWWANAYSFATWNSNMLSMCASLCRCFYVCVF